MQGMGFARPWASLKVHVGVNMPVKTLVYHIRMPGVNPSSALDSGVLLMCLGGSSEGSGGLVPAT